MRRLFLSLAAGVVFAGSRAVAQGVPEGAPLEARPEVPVTQKAAPAPPAGNADHGKAVFVADGCYECHGFVGQGSIRTGPALVPTVPFVAFQLQLRHPADRMPIYTEAVLPVSDIQDIYAYLQSLPKPPDPATLAALQP